MTRNMPSDTEAQQTMASWSMDRPGSPQSLRDQIALEMVGDAGLDEDAVHELCRLYAWTLTQEGS